MNIYFIPGLGADKRIFRNISIPEGFNPYYLDWIRPIKNETLEEYSYRLSESIDITQPYIIVGLSFGGMLATEIINRYPSGKMILLSSIPSAADLPTLYKIAGKMHMHKLVPIGLLKSASLMKRLFTAETPEQKSYLKKTIREVDSSFIRWALNAIVKWKGSAANNSYLHIHGSKDALLPLRYCRPTHVIQGGGHLMILTRTSEINDILKEYLQKI